MKKNIFCLSVTVVISVLYGVCAYGAQSSADVPVTPDILEKARESVLGKTADVAFEQEYVIGHGDILGVQIYGEGDMSAASPIGGQGQRAGDSVGAGQGVIVRIDGRISLKHLGDVEAVGFTPTQLADYLKVLFATVYDDPLVTVVLMKSNSKRYTVMGKVAQPGVFLLDFPINIVQVVARCGGFTEWAKTTITLIRKDPTILKELFDGNKLAFDYDDFLEGENLEKNVLIKPDDIIIVH